MSKPTLHQVINQAVAKFPKELTVLVTEEIAKAWDAGREEAHRDIISRPYAKDVFAFAHPADQYDSGL